MMSDYKKKNPYTLYQPFFPPPPTSFSSPSGPSIFVLYDSISTGTITTTKMSMIVKEEKQPQSGGEGRP